VAVVQLAGFEQKHLPRRAAVQRPATVKLLHALFGEADQVAVMEMRVVGMPFEMRTDRLDAGFGILLQIDPVIGTHDGSMNSASRCGPAQYRPLQPGRLEHSCSAAHGRTTRCARRTVSDCLL